MSKELYNLNNLKLIKNEGGVKCVNCKKEYDYYLRNITTGEYYCVQCFRGLFKDVCRDCGRFIEHDEVKLYREVNDCIEPYYSCKCHGEQHNKYYECYKCGEHKCEEEMIEYYEYDNVYVHGEPVYMLVKKHICKDCYDRYFIKCFNCGEIILKDYNYKGTEDDEYYCYHCYHEKYEGRCYNCNKPVKCSEKHLYYDDNLICEDCLDEYFIACAECGEYEREEDMIKVGDEYVCKKCIDEHYTRCNNCERYIHVDEACYTDWDVYCEDCYFKNCSNYDYIQEKIYDKNKNTYDIDNLNRLYLGIEVEVDGSGDIESFFNDIDDKFKDNYALKNDASLSYNGFEMVMPPVKFNELISNLKYIKDLLISYGFDDEECRTGLHIHINKNGFKNEELYNLIYNYYDDDIKKLYNEAGGRTGNGYAKKNKLRGYVNKVNNMCGVMGEHEYNLLLQDIYKENNEKMLEINFLHNNTYEFRGMDGLFRVNIEKLEEYMKALFNKTGIEIV